MMVYRYDLFLKMRIRLFTRIEAVIIDDLAESSGSTMRDSPDPCREKDARQTIQPVKFFREDQE